MVFDRYQDGYNGSHIIYSSGTGIAFMNVHGVLDSYRFITFLHLTPDVSPFFLTKFPKVDFGPAIEMHTDLKYVYMVYFIEKNRNFICLVLKL